MTQSDITLLIPAYHPGAGWQILFRDRYLEFCRAIDAHVKVVLINDGSKADLSKEIDFLKGALGDNFQYLSYIENRGKGAALKFGALHTTGHKYMFTDIDFPYSVESMKKVWETITSTPGIVTGYREDTYYTDLSSFRTILSKSLRWLNKAILGLPVNDTQCGLKAFDRDVKTLLLHCETDRFLIDLELLLAVNQNKYPITPIAVKLREDINFTRFNSSVLLREILNFLKLILKYRIFSK